MPSNPITFTDGSVLTAAQLNTENNTIYNAFNAHTHSGSQGEPSTISPSSVASSQYTVGDLLKINSSGVLEYGASNTPGWISNIGVSLAAGVFTVLDAQGAAFSSTNPGWVTVPSTTAGQLATLRVTANHTFNDDAHASSDLTNLGFGITEAADWAQDVPFFLYVVNKANSTLDGVDGSSMFFIARHPCMNTTPSAANDIGDTGAIPVNDSQDVILIMADVTVANYVSLPCQLIGGFRMQWSTATDDWTVQTLGNSDGVGRTQLSKHFAKTWTMPTGQNGASASRFMLPNGGTAPAFSTQTYFYRVNENGSVWISVALDSDGGTDGSGAVNARVALPTVSNIDHAVNTVMGPARVTASALTNNGHNVRVADGSSYFEMIGVTGASGAAVDLADFGNGGRNLTTSFTYPAFVV